MTCSALPRALLAALATLVATVPLHAEATENTSGFNFGLDYVADYFSNLDGGIDEGSDFIGLGNVMVDYQGSTWSAHANVFLPHGTSFTGRHAGDFSVVSNIDTGNLDPRLAEFWLQREIGRTNVRFGMLALDSEFWGSAGGAVFINSVFGAPTIVSANLPNPTIFPTATLGIRGQWDVGPAALLRIALVDGDAGDPETANRHGLDVTLRGDEGVFIAAEFEKDWTREGGMPAALRLGAFFHGGDFVAVADGSAGDGTFGVYAVIDQPLGERFGWFGRIGYTRKEFAIAPWSIEAGVHLADWLGSGGTLGVGFAHVDLNDAGAATLGFTPSYESIIELTFEWPISEWFTLQPDVQYILNTGGADAGGDTLVLGVRGKMSF